ncbi:hypothetical protein ASF28_01835 [Methylobacterium sp. Leaf99]|uniref:hypothetical protein n=1 Tax=Methylobacterium sp. Leaf99 TaxID=1736251 RepID=UPI0006FFD286|nr:hypothetical protein [Methylobacterium sp. Leaf99]KQP09940.1 hypothetical protein ASF28_01835 [Methylobacterium sp. Leaf99]
MSKASGDIAFDRLMAGRRAHTQTVRDLTAATDATRSASSDGKAFGSGRTWLVAAAANIAIVLGVAFCVVLGPPLLECRHHPEIGFSAGDGFQGCARKATAERLDRLESQLRMMMLGSGR